jgi:hypothetical protein
MVHEVYRFGTQIQDVCGKVFLGPRTTAIALTFNLREARQFAKQHIVGIGDGAYGPSPQARGKAPRYSFASLN